MPSRYGGMLAGKRESGESCATGGAFRTGSSSTSSASGKSSTTSAPSSSSSTSSSSESGSASSKSSMSSTLGDAWRRAEGGVMRSGFVRIGSGCGICCDACFSAAKTALPIAITITAAKIRSSISRFRLPACAANRRPDMFRRLFSRLSGLRRAFPHIRNRLPHVCVGREIFQLIIIHHADFAVAQGLRHR